MRGQMFGNLLNTIATQGGRVAKAVGPTLKASAVPAGIGLGVLGLGALGRAGVDAVQGNRAAAGRTPLTGEEPGMSRS